MWSWSTDAFVFMKMLIEAITLSFVDILRTICGRHTLLRNFQTFQFTEPILLIEYY